MFTCTFCGKEFVGHRNWTASKYYCSSKCQYSDIIEEQCLWCHKPIYVKRYLSGTKRYCSASCRNKAYWERKKDRPKTLSIEEAVYLAAFIDGEGTISIRRYKRKGIAGGIRYVPIVEMNNTDLGVMQYLMSVIGPTRYHVHTAQKGNSKKCYQLRLPANTQRWVLETIIPYLKIKRRQAEICLEFLSLLGNKEYGKNDYNLSDREKLYCEVHNRNHRGILV
jgi:hypothetical protein